MRDDLHRTVSVTRPWKRVLRCIDLPDERCNLRDAIEIAVQGHLHTQLDASWLKKLRSELSVSGTDLLGDDKVTGVIEAHAQSAATKEERRLCELLVAIYERDGASGRMLDTAIKVLCNHSAAANFEHLVAAVRQEAGSSEAARVSAILKAEQSACSYDLNSLKKLPPISKKVGVELLDEDLEK